VQEELNTKKFELWIENELLSVSRERLKNVKQRAYEEELSNLKMEKRVAIEKGEVDRIKGIDARIKELDLDKARWDRQYSQVAGKQYAPPTPAAQVVGGTPGTGQVVQPGGAGPLVGGFVMPSQALAGTPVGGSVAGIEGLVPAGVANGSAVAANAVEAQKKKRQLDRQLAVQSKLADDHLRAGHFKAAEPYLDKMHELRKQGAAAPEWNTFTGGYDVPAKSGKKKDEEIMGEITPRQKGETRVDWMNRVYSAAMMNRTQAESDIATNPYLSDRERKREVYKQSKSERAEDYNVERLRRRQLLKQRQEVNAWNRRKDSGEKFGEDGLTPMGKIVNPAMPAFGGMMDNVLQKPVDLQNKIWQATKQAALNLQGLVVPMQNTNSAVNDLVVATKRLKATADASANNSRAASQLLTTL
jgi:hypothetical protein